MSNGVQHSHIFERTGLIEASGSPGTRWPEFSASFDRTDKAAMETLGQLASYLVLQTIERTKITDYVAVANRFGAQAEPPISFPESLTPANEIVTTRDMATEEEWGALAFYNGVTHALQSAIDKKIAPQMV